MKAEDDERSITWAPEKIKGLERRTSELENQLKDALGRISGLERDEQVFERFNAVEERFNEAARRIMALENVISDAVKDGWSSVVRSIDPEFSEPIGGRGPETKLGGLFAVGNPERGVVPSDFHDGPDTYEAQPDLEKPWMKGFKRGHAAALEEAESRVVAKLVEMGWAPRSPAMLGVINALRGTKPIKDHPQG